MKCGCDPSQGGWSDGCWTCFQCGLQDPNDCQYDYMPIVQYPGRNFNGSIQPCYASEIRKRRFYSPLTHFREHLRRYQGLRVIQLDPEMLFELGCQFNPKDKNAPSILKSLLKPYKNPLLYKEIFKILYSLNGVLIHITPQQYQSCLIEYQKIMFIFMKYRERFSRKAMPSCYIMMDILLRQSGHEPVS
jgi:hypothetical protein